MSDQGPGEPSGNSSGNRPGDPAHDVTSLEALGALYDAANPISLAKELDHVSPDYARFIEASPFVALATVGAKGVDVTPRGDPAGFVEIADDRTLLLPDRRGNNRLDSLKNILVDNRVSLMFLVPTVGEVLRVGGRARINADPALCARFTMQGKPPTSVLIVSVERVYYQCQKAFYRSGLWKPETWPEARGGVPTAGQINQRVVGDGFDGAAYDAEYPERMKRVAY